MSTDFLKPFEINTRQSFDRDQSQSISKWYTQNAFHFWLHSDPFILFLPSKKYFFQYSTLWFACSKNDVFNACNIPYLLSAILFDKRFNGIVITMKQFCFTKFSHVHLFWISNGWNYGMDLIFVGRKLPFEPFSMHFILFSHFSLEYLFLQSEHELSVMKFKQERWCYSAPENCIFLLESAWLKDGSIVYYSDAIPYSGAIRECMSPNPHLDCSMRVKYFCVHLLDRIQPLTERRQWKFRMFRTLLPSIRSTSPAAMHTIFHWYVSMVRDRRF